MEIKDIGPSYRKEDEKYEDYTKRRRIENKLIKNYLKGKNVWNAALKSTYIKPKKDGQT